MQHMAKNVVAVNEGKTKFMVSLQSRKLTLLEDCIRIVEVTFFFFIKLQAVKNKYSNKKLLEVSRIPQLKSTVVKNMATAALGST